jgi:hypothetical protein
MLSNALQSRSVLSLNVRYDYVLYVKLRTGLSASSPAALRVFGVSFGA